MVENRRKLRLGLLFLLCLVLTSCNTEEKEEKDFVTIAILAKDKSHTLPLYLDSIEKQTWPKKNTYIYIRTNDNNDETAEILETWIQKVGSEYAKIYFDKSDIDPQLKQYAQHDWNTRRFAVLGAIRQESVRWAKEHDSHYFVADCDNFIIPETIEALHNTNLPVVAPLLQSGNESRYSNYHAAVDDNGYYADSPLYDMILYRQLSGLIELPVVHCTYFIQKDVLDDVLYDDHSYRYEYVIFSDNLRKRNIPQYIDNRKVYGWITFANDTSSLIHERWIHEWDGYLENFSAENIKSQDLEGKDRIIVVSPQAGMCNRFRVLASCDAMATQFGYEMRHTWNGREPLSPGEPEHRSEIKRTSFADYGQPPPEDTNIDFDLVLTEWPADSNWGRLQTTPTNCQDIRVTKNPWVVLSEFVKSSKPLPKRVFVQTSLASHDPENDEQENQLLRNRFYRKSNMVDFKREDPFTQTIGIHVRLGDHVRYHPEVFIDHEQLDPLIALIEKEGKRWRIFSDDPSIRSYYGLHNQTAPFEDWTALTCCDAIVGTPFSSFGYEAAVAAGIPYTDQRTPIGILTLINEMSQLGVDRYVLDKCHRKEGFFMDIGCADPMKNSNILLLQRNGWHGIAIDALPYSGWEMIKNTHFIQACLYSEADQEVSYIIPDNNHHFAGIVDYINRHAWVKTHGKPEYTTFKTRTIGDILADMVPQVPQTIDYLSVGTEGSEYEVLKTFPFEKYSCRYISLEHNFEEPKRSQINQLLTAKGYRRIHSVQWDDLYEKID